MALKIGRHGHFKGVVVLVIYHLVALVELLAAILRVRTQERVCGPKGNTRTKNFELCQTRVEGKNESRIYMGKRQKAIYRLVTAPQGGTQKYTLAFACDSPR